MLESVPVYVWGILGAFVAFVGWKVWDASKRKGTGGDLGGGTGGGTKKQK